MAHFKAAGGDETVHVIEALGGKNKPFDVTLKYLLSLGEENKIVARKTCELSKIITVERGKIKIHTACFTPVI